MSLTHQVGNRTLKLIVGDLTALDIEAFVFYAAHNLQLGSGFGTAVTIRGGPKVQEELNTLGPLQTTEAIVSGAGELPAQHIVHAVGPRFQEEDTESKLRLTIQNSMRAADAKGVKVLAFPPMGAGFYGIPLEVCAEIMISTIVEYLSGDTGIDEVVICALDKREYQPFEKQLAALGQTIKEAV
jgi:O-acetyl-ADP-ribose deacetylase (regulator of RNase III)